MSYLLKIQSSPGAVAESILNNSKHFNLICNSCGKCFRYHPVFQSSVQELSSYVSALKNVPVKKKVSKKKPNDSFKKVEKIDLQKLTKLIKLTSLKNEHKGRILGKNKQSESDKIKEKSVLKPNYSVDSTKSYDPNLLFYSLEVEKFFKGKVKKSTLLKNESANSVKSEASSEKLTNKLIDKANYSTEGSNLKEIKMQTTRPKENKLDMLQKNVAANKVNLFKLLNVNKLSQVQPLEEPMRNVVPDVRKEKEETPRKNNLHVAHKNILSEEEKEENLDFENFSVRLSSNSSLALFLHSSIDVCVTNDMLMEAFELLQTYRKKIVYRRLLNGDYKTLVEAYNTLLHGLSAKGHWHFMQKVIHWMKIDHVQLNSESFAAMLYCLEKIRKPENEKLVMQEVTRVINQLFVNNISLNDIFYKTVLTKEKAEKILTIIREVVPFFEIKPVTIKLSSDCPLTKNLYSANSTLQSPVDKLEIETLEHLVEEQLLLEKKFYINVKSVSRGYKGELSIEHKKKFEKLKEEWRKSLTEAILKVIRVDRAKHSQFPEWCNLYIYLESVPVKTLVDILMDLTLNLIEYSGGFSPSTSQFRMMIGNRVAQCYQIRKKEVTGLLDRTEKLFKQYITWYLDPSGPAKNARQKWQMLIQDSDRSSQLDCKVVRWPDEVISRLGKYLLDIVVKEVKFSTEKNGVVKFFPALFTILRYHGSIWREEIKCHPSVTSLFQKIGFETLYFRADQMPMVCPPKPWKCTDHGGYLFLNTDFIRKSTFTRGRVIRFREIPSQQMFPTYDSLNALQAVPWIVNEDVLDVALEVFKNGGSKKLNVPNFPDPVEVEFKKIENMSYEERMADFFRKKELSKKRCNEYALWCEALYRLSLANHFRKRLFWFPQNCDFRGRVYPVPPLLNHLGSDLFRSLLVFGKGKPLGPKGLDWIKIHLINLTGTHKRKTIRERLAYANEILPVILDSAEKPLTGDKWWTESDEPWQTLATCMEIKKILSSPNPEHYVCKFPVHQDGSCNGLQHYAALGKDKIGATSVNLASLDAPQDVYTAVAELIEQERIKDAEKGVEIASKLDGFIDRKVVKQTVMTTVYGVTIYGAKLQIAKRLQEIPNFPEEYVKPAAAYLTDKTFLCLQKMFTSAKEIQDWFIKCAELISSINDYVQWPSPLGLPVLQGYGKFRMNYDLKRKIIVPDSMKQRNAFPPNFIHSLDSCHMMLTALFCEQAGLTFAAVHDCFWTHPNNVDIMNRICREQFVSLHSQPILTDLSNFFKKLYLQNEALTNKKAVSIFETVPEKGNFDLKEVLNSVYFFS